MTDQAWQHYNEAKRQLGTVNRPGASMFTDSNLAIAVAQVEAILAVAGALLGEARTGLENRSLIERAAAAGCVSSSRCVVCMNLRDLAIHVIPTIEGYHAFDPGNAMTDAPLLGKPAVVVTEGHGCPECGAVVDHSWMSDEAREEYHDRLHVVDAPVEEELA